METITVATRTQIVQRQTITAWCWYSTPTRWACGLSNHPETQLNAAEIQTSVSRHIHGPVAYHTTRQLLVEHLATEKRRPNTRLGRMLKKRRHVKDKYIHAAQPPNQEIAQRLADNLLVHHTNGTPSEQRHIGPYGAHNLGGVDVNGTRIVYTDGSFSQDQHTGAWGWWSGDQHDVQSATDTTITSTDTETAAITLAIQAWGDNPLRIYSDSTAAIKHFTRPAHKTPPRLKHAADKVRDGTVELVWVPGHAGIYGNSCIDRIVHKALRHHTSQ